MTNFDPEIPLEFKKEDFLEFDAISHGGTIQFHKTSGYFYYLEVTPQDKLKLKCACNQFMVKHHDLECVHHESEYEMSEKCWVSDWFTVNSLQKTKYKWHNHPPPSRASVELKLFEWQLNLRLVSNRNEMAIDHVVEEMYDSWPFVPKFSKSQLKILFSTEPEEGSTILGQDKIDSMMALLFGWAEYWGDPQELDNQDAIFEQCCDGIKNLKNKKRIKRSSSFTGSYTSKLPKKIKLPEIKDETDYDTEPLPENDTDSERNLFPEPIAGGSRDRTPSPEKSTPRKVFVARISDKPKDSVELPKKGLPVAGESHNRSPSPEKSTPKKTLVTRINKPKDAVEFPKKDESEAGGTRKKSTPRKTLVARINKPKDSVELPKSDEPKDITVLPKSESGPKEILLFTSRRNPVPPRRPDFKLLLNIDKHEEIKTEPINKIFRFAEHLVKKSTKIDTRNGLDIFAVPLTKINKLIGLRSTVERFVFGKVLCPEKQHMTVLVLGATCLGKAKLINGIINHIFHVVKEDHFRFEIVEEKINHRLNCISVYEIHHAEGFRTSYSLTIVHMPSYNTEDVKLFRNGQLIQTFRDFFEDVAEINDVNLICNVVMKDEVRNSFLSIFGYDVEENIHCFWLRNPEDIIQRFFSVLNSSKKKSLKGTKEVLQVMKRLEENVNSSISLRKSLSAKEEEMQNAKLVFTTCQSQIEANKESDTKFSLDTIERTLRKDALWENVENEGRELFDMLKLELDEIAKTVLDCFEIAWVSFVQLKRISRGNPYLTVELNELLFDAEEKLKLLGYQENIEKFKD